MKACVTYAKRGINLITMNFTFMARSKVQNLQILTDILFFFSTSKMSTSCRESLRLILIESYT